MQEPSTLYDMLVRHVAARVALSEEDKQRLRSAFTVRRVLPRQYLLQQGEVCRHEHFVCEGLLRSFFVDDQGNEHTLRFALEDWWITDLRSFLRQTAATHNIVAIEPVTVLQIDHASRENLFLQSPVFERFWRILNEQAAAAQDERILNNIMTTGAERYAALQERYPGLEQRLPQKYIASYLGITPVFLSRIRKQQSLNNNGAR